MDIESRVSDEDVLRGRAVKRLKKQSDFRVHLSMYLIFNALVVAIWLAIGSGFFWPIFLIAGWGIGVVANAWDAYGVDAPSEHEISREMDRLRNRS